MTILDRRQFLHTAGVAGATAGLGALLFDRAAAAAIGDTLTIAYHVPLPAWDPTTGLSSVNPQLMSIYKCVFDQYVDQNADLSFRPGLLTKWGWTDGKSKIRMEGAPGRQMAGRQAGHGGRHRLEPAAGRRFEDRQPSVLHLGLGRQPEGGGQRRHRRRQAVHAGPVQVDGIPDRLCPAAAPLREGRRGGLREAADGLRPLHGGRVPARLLRPSQGEP